MGQLIDETYWRGPDEVCHSLTFPVGEEPDPAMVAAIRREFFPEYVPLYVTKLYVAPDGSHVPLGYHAIGRWARYPDDDTEEDWDEEIKRWVPRGQVPLRVLRPIRFRFRGGVIYEQRILENAWPEHTRERACNWPAVALPVHWGLFDWMQAAQWRLMRQLRMAKWDILDAVAARDYLEQRDLQKVQGEARHRLRGDRNMIGRAIDQKKFDDAPPGRKGFVHLRGGRA